MDKYIKTGSLTWIREHFAGSVSGETVTIKIRQDSTGYWWNFSTTAFAAASASGAMTFDAEGAWKASFTPPADGTYSVWLTYDSGTLFHSIEAVALPIPASIAGSEVTIAEVKEAMGITGTGQDTILTNLIARAVEEVENSIIHRKLSVQTFTEYYDGGHSCIFLNNYPVVSITSVNDDPYMEWGSDTLIDSDEYFTFNDVGEIALKTYYFMAGEKNVKVVYSAGYATFPRDIKEAIIKIVYAEYLLLKGSGNAIDGGSDSKPKTLREEALAILKNYARIR